MLLSEYKSRRRAATAAAAATSDAASIILATETWRQNPVPVSTLSLLASAMPHLPVQISPVPLFTSTLSASYIVSLTGGNS